MATLKNMLEDARDRRRQEYGRSRGRGYQKGSCNKKGMSGDGIEELETDDNQMSGGTRGGETMRERYARTETGDAQVGG